MTFEEIGCSFLAHHGIKGQKWGIRRYQNPDGTLTPEGRKRYGVGQDGKMSKEGRKIYEQDKKHYSKTSKYIDDEGKLTSAGQARYDQMQKEVNEAANSVAKFANMHYDLEKNKPADGSMLLVTEDYKDAYEDARKYAFKCLTTINKYGAITEREDVLDSGKQTVQIMIHDSVLDTDIKAIAYLNDYTNEIKHHGINLQKWGIRRYQYKDGTYTELGKLRKRESRKANYSKDYVQSRSKRSTKEMSNEELKFATERRRLETQYKQAKKPSYDNSALSRGQKFAAGFAGLTASAVAIGKAWKPIIQPLLDKLGKTVIKKGTVIL